MLQSKPLYKYLIVYKCWMPGHLEQSDKPFTVTSVLVDHIASYQEVREAASEAVSWWTLLYVSEWCGWRYYWWCCPLWSRCRPDGVPYPTLDLASARAPLSDPLSVPLWGPRTAPGALPSTSLRISHIIIIIPACVCSTRQFLTRICFHRLVKTFSFVICIYQGYFWVSLYEFNL